MKRQFRIELQRWYRTAMKRFGIELQRRKGSSESNFKRQFDFKRQFGIKQQRQKTVRNIAEMKGWFAMDLKMKRNFGMVLKRRRGGLK